MQHPTGAALPPLVHEGEQKATMETGEPAKEVQTLPSLDDPSSYQLHEHQSGQMPLMHPGMNGVPPPALMYSEYAADPMASQLHQQHLMGQLETQFGQFGLQEQQGTSDHLDSSGHNSNSDNNIADDIEGEDGDEEPVKLFVGQVR